MPYTLKTQQIAVKDPDTGAYTGVDILTEQTTEGLLTEITTEGANQVQNVENAGAATVTLVNNTVSQSQTAVNNLVSQKDDLVESVTDMLSTGTDNSLTTPTVPADAKAVGDLYETIVIDSTTQPNKRWNRVWVKPSEEEIEIPTMDEMNVLWNGLVVKDNLIGRWNQVSLTSSSGDLSPTLNERSTLAIFVPNDVISFSCSTINSCVSAYNGSEYIGVLNQNNLFEKTFHNVDYVDFQYLFSTYPDYSFRITVYCYPNDIEQNITIYRSKRDDRIKVCDTINTLGKYIESYYKIAHGLETQLVYASNTGLFAESVTYDNVNAIHCSGLVYAALCKIYYNNSRYNGLEKNVNNGFFWKTDGSVSELDYMPSPYVYPDYLRADQLAKYFDGKGMLIPFNAEHNDLQPGDLVFISYNKQNNYKGITHVCVALNYSEYYNIIRTVDGSSKTKINGDASGVNYSELDVVPGHVYYAKPHIVQDVNFTLKIAEGCTLPNDINGGAGKTVSNGRNVMNNLPCGFYTIIIDGPASSDMLYYAQIISYPSNTYTDGDSNIAVPKNINAKQIIHFVVPETEYGLNVVYVNAKNMSENAQGVSPLNYRIFTGWIIEDPESV